MPNRIRPQREVGGSRRRARGVPRQARPRPSLLILHLDADKLRRDGLYLGDQAAFSALLSQLSTNADVAIEESTSRAHLHRVLAALVEAGRTFDVVVAIAHSNHQGIKIASADDDFVDWDALAEYLKPLVPRRLVLVACQAGQWPAARCMFSKLPRLRRIYASPVNASRNLAELMLLLVPHVVAIKVPPTQALRWMQAAAVALTGGQVRMWNRSDMNSTDGQALDLIALALDPVARRVPEQLRRLLR